MSIGATHDSRDLDEIAVELFETRTGTEFSDEHARTHDWRDALASARVRADAS